MNFPALKDAEGKLNAKRQELADIFAEAQSGGEGTIDLSKVKAYGGDTSAAAAAIKALNDEMADLGQKADELKAVQRAAEVSAVEPEAVEAGDARPAGRRAKSLGEMFVESAAYKQKTGSSGPEATLDVDPMHAIRNVLFETGGGGGAGWAPESTRSGDLVLSAQRPVQVTDLIPSFSWNQSAYVYMEETLFTNNAAEAAEAAAYGEAALALTEQTSAVRKVAVWLPVTDEQLEDVPGARGYVDARLMFMLRQRLDSQILVGTGAAPQLRGVNNLVGIQTQALGADPVFDAVHRAMTLVRVNGRATPNAVVFHPTDWQDVRLTRTADGIYILGNPVDAGPSRLWGVQVVESDAQTLNTAVVGDFANYAMLPVRRGIDVQITNSHNTDFINGRQAIRADMRTALVFTRPAAFCTVTGI